MQRDIRSLCPCFLFCYFSIEEVSAFFFNEPYDDVFPSCLERPYCCPLVTAELVCVVWTCVNRLTTP